METKTAADTRRRNQEKSMVYLRGKGEDRRSGLNLRHCRYGQLRSSNFSYLKQTLIKPGTNNPELYQMCLSLKWCSDSEVYFHFVISHQSAQQETKQLTVELPLRSSSCLQLHRHHPPSLLCTCSDCLSLSDSEPCPSLPVNIWTSAIDLISQQIKGCPVHRSIHIICCVEHWLGIGFCFSQ